MFCYLTELCIIILLLPLSCSIIVGIGGANITLKGAHRITILGIGATWILSMLVAKSILLGEYAPYSENLYVFASGGDYFPFIFNIGILVDPLSVVMLVIVSFISLLVHVYSVGYMEGDRGYKRFFSYISFFTFSMYLLVIANNFLQLFIGWEGVGVASYLLIGFWFNKESANLGSLKAFIVNRVSDFGFILGIAVIFAYVGSLDYQVVFSHASKLVASDISFGIFGQGSVITVICLLLFWGAMGKSAQVPLHVWLPESMEGPTPISALIHAATMVTAGIFMVVRMSPLYEYSEFALSFILIIGATGALFTGILAIVMNDIKRVVAYSTLSQLGYMMAALGVSAYSAGIFHLITHAFFKALLFLSAGSVILAMHHEQDIRKMGGLYKYMPITYYTSLIGSLALVALPPFAGFYSKDMIIEAISMSNIYGARYAYFCVVIGAMVTAIYTFRAFFMTFHGKSRIEKSMLQNIKEPKSSVYIPLIILAIFSVISGFMLVDVMLFTKPILTASIKVLPEHDVLTQMANNFHGASFAILHAFSSPVFWLTIFGLLIASVCYLWKPAIPDHVISKIGFTYRFLLNKYGIDDFNNFVFVKGARFVGDKFAKVIDDFVIDQILADWTSARVTVFAKILRKIQTGVLNHYLAYMIFGTLLFMLWLMLR